MLNDDEIENNLLLEQKWLETTLNDNNVLMLVAEYDDEIIANAEIRIKPLQKVKHWGELGITIKDRFRQFGLGKLLIVALIDLAKTQKHLEYIRLSVFEQNKNAISLYEKLGFEKCGIINNAFKYLDLSYDNEIIMLKKI